jgi:NADPH2:quinone reductase
VREATGGRGTDVVFDGVGGQIGEEAFGITACGGFAEIDPQEAERRGVRVGWDRAGAVRAR